MLLIKLGGSVITNKDRECTFLPKRARRLVEELRYIDEPIIITHGGGSFGHKKASFYRLNEGLLKDLEGSEIDQVMGYSEVQKDMRQLNNLVLDMMTMVQMRAVSIPAAAVVDFSNGKMSKMGFKMFDQALKMGSIPVSFGDVVIDSKITFTICSADDLMVKLAQKYKPSRAVFVTDVDGLFSKNPEIDLNAPLIREVRSAKDIPKFIKGKKKERTDRDVTGGMGSKSKVALKIASMGIETWFVNGCVEDRTGKVLKGYDVVGTKFIPKRPRKPKGRKANGVRKGRGGKKR